MYKSITSKFLQVFILLFCFSSTAVWAAPPINTLEKSGFFKYKPSGVAIRGYDTVAYFTLAKETKGNPKFSTKWNGATWHFSSQKHLDLFVKNPSKYAPQYGGYCAYGVAVDNLVKIEGNLWDVVGGKLYLNYDKKLQKKWRANIPGFIKTADQKFQGLLKTK